MSSKSLARDQLMTASRMLEQAARTRSPPDREKLVRAVIKQCEGALELNREEVKAGKAFHS